jgi:hypothetical protein
VAATPGGDFWAPVAERLPPGGPEALLKTAADLLTSLGPDERVTAEPEEQLPAPRGRSGNGAPSQARGTATARRGRR